MLTKNINLDMKNLGKKKWKKNKKLVEYQIRSLEKYITRKIKKIYIWNLSNQREDHKKYLVDNDIV